MNNKIEPLRNVLKQYPFQFLMDIFKEVDKNTQEKTDKKYWIWSEHYSNWIDMMEHLLKIPPSNSLLQIRFIEFNRILLWIQTCVYCGQYYSALRELRFLFEFILKAYYVDEKFPEETIKFKNNKIKKLYGSKLIKQLYLEENIKKRFKTLYGKLSAYTHPSKDELAEMLKGNYDIHLTFAFNETMFNKCVNLTNKVVDSVFFIIFNRHENIIIEFKTKELFIKSLEDLDCELTLEIINKR